LILWAVAAGAVYESATACPLCYGREMEPLCCPAMSATGTMVSIVSITVSSAAEARTAVCIGSLRHRFAARRPSFGHSSWWRWAGDDGDQRWTNHRQALRRPGLL